MLSIIVCEGRTDAIFLSYYLLKTQQWEYIKGSKIPVKIPVQNSENEEANWYKKGDNFLAIWGVGGKSNFKYAIESIEELNKLGNKSQFFSKIAILADKDNDEEEEKINELNELFSFRSEISLINRQWITVEFNDLYEMHQQVDLACLVVPFEGPGAMESFLLQVLSGDAENEQLIKAVKRFIQSTVSERYLHNNRQKLKAEFATVLSIMYPERVFTLIDSFLRSVPWEQYNEFQEGFNLFEQI
ncbi:hypothetical protein GA0061096_1372 [Fictibacillus enclensis]|uniref:DUF3226 domain-containing protein n=1 Tax=Fictibacillus enclensis TaxID=1017270 RepID=A0A0V8JE91_9BACL|nr:DUF3226 domain-containing protein [Fictibacillus enclensis]KSU85176.1 hypothetical protein AS030_06570 [Fictibacillus enclensis]SCB92157.1 hypothetical protein GA0061096_1372 [Fictibacillus enclensis]